MAYLTNSIGNKNFITLLGEIDENGQTLVVDSRPGVTGLEFTLTADKGQPFQLISIVDCNDLQACDFEVIGYKLLIADNPVNIIKNSVMALSLFKVLAVTPVEKRKIAVPVGNKLSAQAGALLTCRWDLVATA